jgi:hypothetical protein
VQVSLRVDGVHFASFNERGNDCPLLAATVGAGEEMIFAPERHLAVILPISGRMSSSTIAGIRCTGKARVAFRLNGAQRASSCTSSWDRVS